ncbi:LytTR family DNA-binding domain-containing protein [Polaribacter sargassicola]|uniref:LytTR family DNA-binding domain-containing protein n=1 Tax=Polaribacter sargassicola TaxID=2836891 RepID=UPI001F463257|nr:LytTR family DNA-binding domain-containing protein [Polaribacter sp. DS7-9]MCG1035086.1 LytTR family transcriptional regulator [Polaribacter sp. DS7-9]
MKKLFYWLSTPYYFNPSIKFKFKVSISMGIFIFLFLYFFRPFYLSSFTELVLEYTAFIGFITFLGIFFILFIPPIFLKKYFHEDNWTIGRSLFLIIIGVFIIGSSLWYLGNLFKNFHSFRSINYFRYLSYSYLVGTLPIVFFVFFNEKKLREKRKKKAEKTINTLKNKQKENKVVLEEFVTIYSDNKKEKISFKITDLVYITSEGNYASFFILTDNKKNLKEKILRVTLSKINNELETYKNIIRCHKSYIINANYIKDIKGNARGYLLKSNIISFDIPVSRSFSKNSLENLIK